MGNGFDWALRHAEHGGRVTRAGWNGAGQWVGVQRPGERSKMTRPYLYLSNVRGELVPWLPSQEDLLAKDWGTANKLPEPSSHIPA